MQDLMNNSSALTTLDLLTKMEFSSLQHIQYYVLSVTKTITDTHQCLHYCWTVLTQHQGLLCFSCCPMSKKTKSEKEAGTADPCWSKEYSISYVLYLAIKAGGEKEEWKDSQNYGVCLITVFVNRIFSAVPSGMTKGNLNWLKQKKFY